jgi:DNA primase
MGGDGIKFVQLYRNLEFMDALRDICDKLGWNFDDYHQERKASPKIEMGKKLLSTASKLYRKVAETGKYPAFNDFLEKRGLSQENAKTYQLGYAPDTRALFDYLCSIKEEKDRNFALQVAEEVGLIKKSSYGEKSHYDTFRDRIMFPIWDQFGQVIGFTSRATSDEQKPKYLNSLDSFLFNKKNLLYGLHLAKSIVRQKDSVLIVEGNMDQVALFKNGFENSVAIMGVALGDNSLIKVLSMTKNVMLSLDNDQAGWKAGTRINAQFMDQGVTPLFLDMGEYKDPDEYLIGEGPVAMQKLIDEAKPFIDVEIEKLMPEPMPSLSERKLDILQEVFKVISPLKNTLSATERAVTWAKRLGLQSDSASIIKSYTDFLAGNQKTKVMPTPTVESDQLLEVGELDREKVEISRKLTTVETSLLQELVQHPELLLNDEITELLDFVGNVDVKGYILKLKDLMYEIDESEYPSVVSTLMNQENLSAEITAVAGGALYKYRETSLNEKVALQMILDIKKRLQVQQLKEEKDSLKIKQAQAQTQEEQQIILTKLLEVDKKISQVRAGPKAKK